MKDKETPFPMKGRALKMKDKATKKKETAFAMKGDALKMKETPFPVKGRALKMKEIAFTNKIDLISGKENVHFLENF